MRIILELKTETLKESDIVYYDGKKWVNKSKKAFLLEQQKQIEALQEENAEIKQAFDDLKESVNEKLKQYHDILKLQVEENE